MYQIFNNFLDVDTWHTRHAADEKRFFRALDGVVREPGFNPDAMAQHMTAHVNNPGLNYAIEHYQAAAWAVLGYLRAIEDQG